MFYYQDANQYAAAILKMNSNDSYCTKLRRDFHVSVKNFPGLFLEKLSIELKWI